MAAPSGARMLCGEPVLFIAPRYLRALRCDSHPLNTVCVQLSPTEDGSQVAFSGPEAATALSSLLT